MSCADVCLFDHYDWERNDFHTAKTVRARKPHKCCECRKAIPAGSQYERVAAKSDGEMWTAKSCLPCAEVREAWSCGSWVYGELWEQAAEELFPMWRERGPWDCLAKLSTPEAAAKANAQYARWAEDHNNGK